MQTVLSILSIVVLAPVVLLLLFAIWLGLDRLIQKIGRGYVIWVSGHFRTTVIFYSEGKNRIHFISHEAKESFQIPDATEWATTMPEWARDRRQQILERIRRDWRTKKLFRLSSLTKI